MDTRTFEMLYGGERIQEENQRQYRLLLDIIDALNSINLIMCGEEKFRRHLSRLQLDLTLVTWHPHLVVSGFIGSNLAPELDAFPKFILCTNGFRLFEKGIDENQYVEVNWEKEGF